jgi:hypothetical protein
MDYGSPAPFVAFALALVSGTLLVIGSYIGGAVTGVLAITVFGLWRFARERGDDDRHTIW